MWERVLFSTWEEIQLAGEGPLALKEAVDRFVEEFRQAFDDSVWSPPDMLYLQLVDQHQRAIRTVRGFGMPLSFEFLPAHPLATGDAQAKLDIQADVVHHLRPEFIVGNDCQRFDQRIFFQYGHERFSRFWFPLFPLLALPRASDDVDAIEAYLQNALAWPDEKQGSGFVSQAANWVARPPPPADLVLGTVEIGYLRKSPDRLRLDPWTPEQGTRAMATGLFFANRLFRATQAGALERIGSALALVRPGRTHALQLHVTNGRKVETREYPAPAPWGVAIARATDGPAPQRDQPPLRRSCTVVFEQPGQAAVADAGVTADLCQEIDQRVSRAADVASHLFRGFFYPQELVVPDRNPSAMGLRVKDETVLSVCEEAAVMAGAVCCLAYFFAPGEDTPSLRRPPTVWGEMPRQPSDFRTRVDAEAEEVAAGRTSRYDVAIGHGTGSSCLTMLPLELSEATTGVLALIHQPGNSSPIPVLRADLERRIPRWVYRLHILHLVSHSRFLALTTSLRKEIAEAYRNFTNGHRNVRLFIEDVVRKSVQLIKPVAAWITDPRTTPQAGPSRIYRHWCIPNGTADPPRIFNHLFAPATPSGPCQEACTTGRPVICSGGDKKTRIRSFITALEQEAKQQHEGGERDIANRLRRFASAVDHAEGESTIVTIPLARRPEEKGSLKPTFTWLLQGDLHSDEDQQLLLLELGEVLAETLHQAQGIERQEYEERSQEQLDALGHNLAMQGGCDDAFGAWLQWLAGKKWPCLGRDVVIWLFSANAKTLVARSCRGQALEALHQAGNLEVIDLTDHPLAHDKIDAARIGSWPLGSSMLWSMPLQYHNRTPGRRLLAAYAKKTDGNHLVSFPMVDATGQVFGVVDCLRSELFEVEEEKVLGHMLRRVTGIFLAKITELRLRRSRETINELFADTKKFLLDFQAEQACKSLVEGIRKFFQCEHCDLFFADQAEAMALLATTREQGPVTDSDRFRFRILAYGEDDEILARCLRNGAADIQHRREGTKPSRATQLSEDLGVLLGGALSAERLVMPLLDTARGGKRCVGLLHLENPQQREQQVLDGQQQKTRVLKRSCRFTAEDLRLAEEMAPALQRILLTIALSEKQVWLIRDVMHSLGHPLQTLRDEVQGLLLALTRGGEVPYLELQSMNDRVEWAFQFVHDARDRWTFFTTPRSPDHRWTYESVNLKDFVQRCCDSMASVAKRGRNRIAYADLKAIRPIQAVPEWLRIAVINLLENACKYSWQDGEVAVALDESDDGTIRVQIRNWGIGIPAEDRERIFQPYYRSRVPDARGTRPGTGIGLAIVREAVENIHRGKILVESVPVREEPAGRTSETGPAPGRVEHCTTFTIALDRATLANLAEQNPTDEGEA
ncbi:MAG: HAMP domain-containing sensor histidine kinase [Thermodesulfobacteriota bacterium]